MKWWPFSRSEPQRIENWGSVDLPLDAMLAQLAEAFSLVSGVSVTPENCMQSPTVQAIVQSIARRISVSPVSVYESSYNAKGRQMKQRLPEHPVSRLLSRPNPWQSRQEFFLDATSTLVRWGRFYAYKAQGNTGPVRRLVPLASGSVKPEQNEQYDVTFRITTRAGQVVRPADEIFKVRGAARDFLEGDSPVTDVREAIGQEIAMERFGASFFGNGAVPMLFFKAGQGFKDFKDDEARDEFLKSVKNSLSRGKAHSVFWLPKGVEKETVAFEADTQQMIESRKYQRSVIAGAFGVPPQFVGDLERATFNNVEQQDTDFVTNVVLPFAQLFESAIERDLLTDEDRRAGRIVRFNLDAIQRADFKTRQEGLRIQRDDGIINANEWREAENRNPIADEDGGELYIVPANMRDPMQEPAAPAAGGNGNSADQPTD